MLSFSMPCPLGGGIKQRRCLTSVMYIGLKSRRERPRKTKIGTEVAHVTRDSDSTQLSRSKVKVTGRGPIVAASHTACSLMKNIPHYKPQSVQRRSLVACTIRVGKMTDGLNKTLQMCTVNIDNGFGYKSPKSESNKSGLKTILSPNADSTTASLVCVLCKTSTAAGRECRNQSYANCILR